MKRRYGNERKQALERCNTRDFVLESDLFELAVHELNEADDATVLIIEAVK